MKDFNKYFDFIADEETKLIVRKIIDKANLVKKNHCTVATDFVTSLIVDYSVPVINDCNVKFKLFPSYEYSERKSLILFPEYMEDDQIIYDKYICGVRIANKSKFKDLEHGNYLGSIMSLGIDRNKVGDIYVHEDYADVICQKDIGEAIVHSLDCVGRNKVDVRIIDLNDIQFNEPEYELINLGVASMRLDNIVKAIINKSRDVCSDIIKVGGVKVNFTIEDKSSRNIKVGDVLSIRKYGRFIIVEEDGCTKSGRIRLIIKHYIGVSNK